MEESKQQDICRVCRAEGSSDKPLFHPCVCTGSIRYIHQDCLLQWLKYSKKEYCELCKHKFSFKPIYSPDMPKRLPIYDIVSGLLKSLARAVRYWFQSTLVALAWLGIVPLTACRIYRCLFTGSVSSLLTLPLDMLSTDNLVSDCFQGCFVVTCTLCAFIGLVWLREQILHGGGPDWLEPEPALPGNQPAAAGAQRPNQQAAPAAGRNAAGQQPAVAVAGQQPGVNEAQDAVNQEEENNEGANDNEDDNDIAQENDWNPIEWDRAAEELTWERLLGLDGSLVFLEHVFWVVSLNTLFVLVFAFCPYHIGHFTITGLHIEEYFSVTQFEGLLTTMLGYIIISVALVILHTFAASASFSKFRRVLGLCYVVVKVSLLVVVEIGIFPLVCGWWLDICSLSMFDATLKDRANSFKLAPGTSMFIHWLVGMVYVFYFASFILLLREVLRPGVLWFLRNLNDPDFNPIHEMIHLPVYRHVRRFLASMVIFGSTVLLMLWLPVKLIRTVIPSFLPYNVMLSSDAPVSELSLELLLLQVVLPALLEQGYTRQWLKGVVHGWCVAIAWFLDIRSYLLGDTPLDEKLEPAAAEGRNNAEQPAPDNQQEQAQDIINDIVEEEENQAELPDQIEIEGPAQPQVNIDDQDEPQANDGENIIQQPVNLNPDELRELHAEAEVNLQEINDELDQVIEEMEQPRPVVPEINIVPAPPQQQAAVPAGIAPQGGLGAAHQAMLIGGGRTGFQPYKRPTFYAFKIVILVVSMCATLFSASVIAFIVPVFIGRKLMALWMGDTKIHELYTAACGLYSCWLFLRAISILCLWIPQGWKAIIIKMNDWFILGAKSVIVASLMIGVIPLLLGLLFELVVVVPLRVPLNQSPIFFPWQDWALGILHAKIMCAITMMLPNWWLRRVVEQVYNQGWRNMNLCFILKSLCFPVIGCLAMCIALPYAFARGLIPVLGLGFEKENLILRRIYPFILCFVLFVAYLVFQVKQFKKLYEHIKNDKYLVGRRLVNYDSQKRSRSESPVS